MNYTNNWKKVLSSTLYFVNDHYFNSQNLKQSFLIVEGFEDKEFYHDFFTKKLKDTEYELSIDYGNIFFDFSSYGFEPEYWKNRKIANEYLPQFDFVIESLKDYNLMLNNGIPLYIDLFGIIDYDANNHSDAIKNVSNLCQSYFRDRETTLLRYSIQPYLLNYKGNSLIEIKNRIKRSLLFTFKQGILNKTSYDFENLYPDISEEHKKKIIQYTNKYYKDNRYKKLYAEDFNQHLSNPGVYSLPSIYKNSFKALLYNNFKSAITKHFCLEINPSLSKILLDFDLFFGKRIDEWLDSADVDNNKEIIDEIFKYSNGHFLLIQFLYHNSNNHYFVHNKHVIRDRDEKKLLDLFTGELISEHLFINKLFSISPYSDYKIFFNKIDK